VALAILLSALVLAAGCAERRAERDLRETLGRPHETTADRREDLQRVVERWPGTAAAEAAHRELESLDSLAQATVRGRSLRAWDAVRGVATAAERYRLRHGHYPPDADALVPRYLDRPVVDPWGSPVLYRRKGRGYQVVCYGSDGLPGGTGDQSDLFVVDGREQP
jgi:hypothetical protein